jgi:hypothetical protein
MQSCAQNPGVKFQWAPVVQGVQGNGKSLLIRVMVHAVGSRYSHLPKASQLTEKFNSWIEGNVFIGVEEIKIADRRDVLDDLKDAATNDRLEIRGMGREKRMGDNFTNWMFCTNHQDAVPIDQNERRYAPLFTAQQTVHEIARDDMSGNYFPDLYDWLKAVGYRHVAWWLRHTPIDGEFDPAGACHRAPMTSSTQEALKASLGRLEQIITGAIEDELVGFRDDWLSSEAVNQLLKGDSAWEKMAMRKRGEMIKSLGYFPFNGGNGRSTICIPAEGNERPILYRRNGRIGTARDYMIAQRYSQVPMS